jgi:hypothetical protein
VGADGGGARRDGCGGGAGVELPRGSPIRDLFSDLWFPGEWLSHVALAHRLLTDHDITQHDITDVSVGSRRTSRDDAELKFVSRTPTAQHR